jgi:hypothetical protein
MEPIQVGQDIAVVARLMGFWWLNACRIVYTVDKPAEFGFAYGTLDWHKQRRLWRGLSGQQRDVAATRRKRGVLLATGFGDLATEGRCWAPQPA